MKVKLFISFFLCFISFSSKAQVNIKPLNIYHPITGALGPQTNFSLFEDSIIDFQAITYYSDVPISVDVFVYSFDSALVMTGSGLSFGAYGNFDTASLSLYNSLTPVTAVDTTIQYIGLKKTYQSNTYYGWLAYKLTGGRLVFLPFPFPPTSYASYDSVFFIEVAWNTVPNMQLRMGHDCYAILPDTVSTCYGASADLTVTGGINFLWSTGDSASTITITSLQDTTYSVTATGNKGCTDTALVFVKILSLPAASIQSNSTEICTNDTVMLTAQGGMSYLWSTGDTASVLSVHQPNDYSVIVMDEYGCSDSASIAITSLGNYPVADFNFTLSEDTARFENLSTDGIDYYWTFGDAATSDDAEPEYIYSQHGVYNVCLLVSNDCGDDSICKTVTVFVSNSSRQIDKSRIVVYTASNAIHIAVDNPLPSVHSVILYNTNGQKIISLQPELNEQNVSIRTDSLLSGMYFCFITFDNGEKVIRKVVVE
ncbi:MAG: PKD domain-containing protein [Chitinophagales bacterium]|nr:PKD domain-containing protein [Chitinophagales bacterium]